MGQDTLENLTVTLERDGQPGNGGDAACKASYYYFDSASELLAYNNLANRSPMSPLSTPWIISRLRHLQTLTLELPGSQSLQLVTEILSEMPINGALQYLNIVCDPKFLSSLVFDPSDTLSEDAFRAFENSIARLCLRQVVFSPAHYRKNRWGFWSSVLEWPLLRLKEHGILAIVTDRPLHCKCA